MTSPEDQYHNLLSHIAHDRAVSSQDIGGEAPRLTSTSPYREDVRKHTFIRGADVLKYILDVNPPGYEAIVLEACTNGFMQTLSTHGMSFISEDFPIQLSWPVGVAQGQLRGMADRGDTFAAMLDDKIEHSAPLALAARFGTIEDLIEMGETFLDTKHIAHVNVPRNVKLPANLRFVKGRSKFN